VSETLGEAEEDCVFRMDLLLQKEKLGESVGLEASGEAEAVPESDTRKEEETEEEPETEDVAR